MVSCKDMVKFLTNGQRILLKGLMPKRMIFPSKLNELLFTKCLA